MAHVPHLVERLHSAVDDLQDLFGRRFTLDGHLVGSLGEIWAAHLYGIKLAKGSSPTHDGKAPGGRLVQIKATQGAAIGLRSEPEHLLVLRLDRKGTPEEVYNGPGALPWSRSGKLQRNGQRTIRLTTLRALMQDVPAGRRIRRIGC